MGIIVNGNCLEELKKLKPCSVDCCITSPPYFGLRDYGVDNQIGLEETPEEYIEKLVNVFREVKRVLKDDGTLWLNIGDSYAGGRGRWGGADNMQAKQKSNSGSLGQIGTQKKWTHETIKQKDLIGIPWMLAFALRADGWYLRQDIIWHKTNPMPESVRDRCTKSHEYIFLLSKSPKYYFDNEAIKEVAVTGESTRDKSAEGYQADYPNGKRFSDGARTYGKGGMRNKRDVWTVPTKPYKDAHFATFPVKLIEPCVLAGCPVGGVVLDPFFGSGTTGEVAVQNGRDYIGIELNPDYIDISKKRLECVQMKLNL